MHKRLWACLALYLDCIFKTFDSEFYNDFKREHFLNIFIRKILKFRQGVLQFHYHMIPNQNYQYDVYTDNA